MRAKVDAAIYRPDLGQAVMEFIESEALNYIGQRVMPLFPTAVSSGTYPVIPKEALLKLTDVNRAPRGTYNRDDFEYERGTFTTTEKGTEEPLDDTERALFGQEAPGLAEILAVQRATTKVMRAQEKRIADMVFNASNFTAHAITHEWDDATNADPFSDIVTGKKAFRLQCGMLPNALIIAWTTMEDLKKTDAVIDRLKYTYPGMDVAMMGPAELARVFDIPQVLVGGAVYDSAGKGIAASVSDIWYNEYAALVRVATRQDLTEPCIGRTFLWTADSPSNPIVEQYREEQRRSDIFRVRHHVDEQFIASRDTSATIVSNVSAACMYLFSNVTTI
jgi:hypothetical protein